MKNYSAEEIVALQIKSDEIIESLNVAHGARVHNREMKKKDKLFSFMRKDMELSRQVLSRLLNYDCITTKISASAECLKLGIFMQEAEKTLEEIAARTDIGIMAFNAKMTLRVWKGEFPGSTL